MLLGHPKSELILQCACSQKAKRKTAHEHAYERTQFRPSAHICANMTWTCTLDWWLIIWIHDKVGWSTIRRWNYSLISVYVCLWVCVETLQARGLDGGITGGLRGGGQNVNAEVMEWGSRPVRRMKIPTGQYSKECINYVWLQSSFWSRRKRE